MKAETRGSDKGFKGMDTSSLQGTLRRDEERCSLKDQVVTFETFLTSDLCLFSAFLKSRQ